MSREKAQRAGPPRSVRLPRELDRWYLERLDRESERSASELLTSLVLGGLRLREGYLAIHRRVLEHYIVSARRDIYAAYVRCLLDTFGQAYVDHLERWLAADGITFAAEDDRPASAGVASAGAEPTAR